MAHRRDREWFAGRRVVASSSASMASWSQIFASLCAISELFGHFVARRSRGRLVVTHRLSDDGSLCRIDTPKDGQGGKVVTPPHIRDDIKSHLTIHVDKADYSMLFAPARGGCHVNDRVFAKGVFNPGASRYRCDDMPVHDRRNDDLPSRQSGRSDGAAAALHPQSQSDLPTAGVGPRHRRSGWAGR